MISPDVHTNDMVLTLAFFGALCFVTLCICATMVFLHLIKSLTEDDGFIPYTPKVNDDDDGEAWKRGGIGPSSNN